MKWEVNSWYSKIVYDVCLPQLSQPRWVSILLFSTSKSLSCIRNQGAQRAVISFICIWWKCAKICCILLLLLDTCAYMLHTRGVAMKVNFYYDTIEFCNYHHEFIALFNSRRVFVSYKYQLALLLVILYWKGSVYNFLSRMMMKLRKHDAWLLFLKPGFVQQSSDLALVKSLECSKDVK